MNYHRLLVVVLTVLSTTTTTANRNKCYLFVGATNSKWADVSFQWKFCVMLCDHDHHISRSLLP